jgi:hypothetical protein
VAEALGAEAEVAFRVQLVAAMVRRAAVVPISIRDVTRADLSPQHRQPSGDAPSLPTAQHGDRPSVSVVTGTLGAPASALGLIEGISYGLAEADGSWAGMWPKTSGADGAMRFNRPSS